MAGNSFTNHAYEMKLVLCIKRRIAKRGSIRTDAAPPFQI